MLQRCREYIKYWRKAKHRHGVHSPFVYELGDQCLRIKVDKGQINEALRINPSGNITRRELRIVGQFILHYQPKKILVAVPDFKELVPFLQTFSKDADFKFLDDFDAVSKGGEATFDLCLLPISSACASFIERQSNETKNLIFNLRKTKNNRIGWRRLCEKDTVHLTIDFFSMGLAIKRVHQQKEHFTMR